MKKDVTGVVTFIGVDLHKCTVTLRAVRQDGELIGHLKISTKSVERIEQWIKELPGPKWMAVEACPFVEWFIDRYTPCVDRMDIADATELALRRGKRRKNDPNDALDIASRLARGECPLGYIADPQLMQLRKLGRHWRRLSQMLSRVKHSMKSMLNAANIRGPKFDGARAHKWFLAHGNLLQPAQAEAFSHYLELMMLIERQRESLRLKILTASRSPQFATTEQLLRTVPGIGVIIASEIGPFDRFPNADALEFWAGMTADLKESAGRTQSGNITKAGSATLRWALCQAAVTLCQSDAKQEATRQRFIARMPRAKANVVMGRRLLRTLFAMIRDGKPYQCGERRDRTKAANKAKAKRRARALQPA
ncbi:MAG: IS110 family transposase [Planctomycetia bacterium]